MRYFIQTFDFLFKAHNKTMCLLVTQLDNICRCYNWLFIQKALIQKLASCQALTIMIYWCLRQNLFSCAPELEMANFKRWNNLRASKNLVWNMQANTSLVVCHCFRVIDVDVSDLLDIWTTYHPTEVHSFYECFGFLYTWIAIWLWLSDNDKFDLVPSFMTKKPSHMNWFMGSCLLSTEWLDFYLFRNRNSVALEGCSWSCCELSRYF